ncbi:nitroreductase family protein [Paenibacillus sp. GSMTC-2017]|uniref:nitroreductase family protein n=1 Tax=Paenibacillus sp. GSMTC-2017 TaxID=2794350 RepID=UPI0018D77A48|nr:nitroreductase family protein [Paenibacillus sp. GSMTC-2017]MBH5319163.1 nitroreductase family protein [Paenibacillus sp. GSMTC-2017]
MTNSNNTSTQAELEKDQSFINVIEGRRSVRKYDNSAVISDEEIREIIAIATKAPSSSNLQPWRFLVVTDAELKAKLLPIAYNQEQVADSSAVIIVVADLEMYKHADTIYTSAATAGYLSEELKDKMIANTTTQYSALPQERLKEIAVFDSGLVSMQLMLAARSKGYDTVPMAGYNRAQVIELFNLSERYLPTILLPIGKAATPGHPTTRLPVDEITFFNRF